MSNFVHLQTAPPDPIFFLTSRCKADPNPNKVDLGIGAYRDAEGRPFILEVVSKVERQVADEKLDKEYLPIDGLPAFRKASAELAFGEDCQALKDERVCTVQTLSGTGACWLAAEFFGKNMPQGLDTPVYLSRPTWGNHKGIFAKAGYKDVREYTYFNPANNGFDFDGMTKDLEAAPERAIVLLQPCAHNPTGADPTKEQWGALLELCKRKSFITLMDCAYQGYATGDLEEDAYAIRLFANGGAEFALCQSYSKNFGMYNERLGCFSLVCGTKEVAQAASSQMKVLIRASYSNPPAHGARVVARIWNDPALRAEWIAEMRTMSARVVKMRKALREALKAEGVAGDWSHITTQIGMFSFTGIKKDEVEKLEKEHSVYMLGNGRMSMPGLSDKNVPYLAKAIAAVRSHRSNL